MSTSSPAAGSRCRSKLFSLFRAAFSQDMNLFNYTTKSTASRASKLALPLLLGIAVMYAVGAMAYSLMVPLSSIGESSSILVFAVVAVSALTFIEGIYKSQSILFECKDNDLLFSLPISKRRIFTLRICKLISFQFIYNLLFLLPIIVVYGFSTEAGIGFYLLGLLALILVPLIPTAIAVVVGYLVKGIAARFKAKKIVQTLLTIGIILVVLLISFNMNTVMDNIAAQAASLSKSMASVYYPAGLFAQLATNFSLWDFVQFLLINIVPFVVVILLGSIGYFRIISRSRSSRSTAVSTRSQQAALNHIKVHTPLGALIRKEFNRYFASTVYMTNTLTSLIILAVITAALCVGGTGVIESFLSGSEEINAELANWLQNFIPRVFLQVVIFTACLTCITASAISIEGKSFNITKSLPVSPKKIFLAKIISSNLIVIPATLICSAIFAIRFRLGLLDILFLFLFGVLTPTLVAVIGLILNLKYPKMSASSDAEVIKQSASANVSVLLGFVIVAITSVSSAISGSYYNVVTAVLAAAFAVAIFVLWRVLATSGARRFRDIDV